MGRSDKGWNEEARSRLDWVFGFLCVCVVFFSFFFFMWIILKAFIEFVKNIASVSYFGVLAPRHVGLGPQPGIKPISSAMEGKVLTAGPLGKSLDWILTKKRGQEKLGEWKREEEHEGVHGRWLHQKWSCWEWLLGLWRWRGSMWLPWQVHRGEEMSAKGINVVFPSKHHVGFYMEDFWRQHLNTKSRLHERVRISG